MTILIFTLHFMGYFTLYIQIWNDKLILLYGAEVFILSVVLNLYNKFYPKHSKLILRNMLLLTVIGFIMLTRLSYDKAVKQVFIVAVSLILSLLVPYILVSCRWLYKFGWVYGVVGIMLLLIVLFAGETQYGATNWLTLGDISFQPSEFVKLLFVFSIASMFYEGTDFKRIVPITIMAAANVLIMVFHKDLGGALIFFVTYVFMLYTATNKALYMFAGLGSGSIASLVAYKLFGHVRVRVMAWQHPFRYIDNEGYQITQSLFAIGTGGFMGLGLNQGLPTNIPVVDSDFIFSAISEELGGLFAISIILIYVNLFIVFMDISIKSEDLFYRLLSLGFAVMFAFQVFLCIGGVIKFIPSTGVTLPLISLGGSSAFSTIIMFATMQGIYLQQRFYKNDRAEGIG